MATITINHPFSMSRQAVTEQLKLFAVDLSKRYQLDCQWQNENCLTFRRSGADGEVRVGDNTLNLELKLGMMLSMFKQSIETDICKFLRENIH